MATGHCLSPAIKDMWWSQSLGLNTPGFSVNLDLVKERRWVVGGEGPTGAGDRQVAQAKVRASFPAKKGGHDFRGLLDAPP